MLSVLNVGGHDKAIGIPSHFDGWRHDLLDIDPKCNPDVLADARELEKLPPASYDAVYCAHNLEHFFPHDAEKVARGFCHILKPTGFAEICVPNIIEVMRRVVQNNMDVEDTLYVLDSGPITVRDVIYGHHGEIERSGNDFYAHKCGFSVKSLYALMGRCGFVEGIARAFSDQLEIIGVFFKQPPSEQWRQLLNIKSG